MNPNHSIIVPSGKFFYQEVIILKKKNKSKKEMNREIANATKYCPYCGGKIVFRSADGIYKENTNGAMLYVCSRYPACDAYVRVHPGTTKPMGTLADGSLRKLRNTAHYYFNQLYETGIMTKTEAYQWLAYQISAPLSQAHIGYLGEYYCNQVIRESQKLLASRKNRRQALAV